MRLVFLEIKFKKIQYDEHVVDLVSDVQICKVLMNGEYICVLGYKKTCLQLHHYMYVVILFCYMLMTMAWLNIHQAIITKIYTGVM